MLWLLGTTITVAAIACGVIGYTIAYLRGLDREERARRAGEDFGRRAAAAALSSPLRPLPEPPGPWLPAQRERAGERVWYATAPTPARRADVEPDTFVIALHDLPTELVSYAFNEGVGPDTRKGLRP